MSSPSKQWLLGCAQVFSSKDLTEEFVVRQEVVGHLGKIEGSYWKAGVVIWTSNVIIIKLFNKTPIKRPDQNLAR
jgi:hypothetical protein